MKLPCGWLVVAIHADFCPRPAQEAPLIRCSSSWRKSRACLRGRRRIIQDNVIPVCKHGKNSLGSEEFILIRNRPAQARAAGYLSLVIPDIDHLLCSLQVNHSGKYCLPDERKSHVVHVRVGRNEPGFNSESFQITAARKLRCQKKVLIDIFVR